MAWLGKVSLGGFPDLAGAVTKFSESVKNIEKNFDSALGLEEKPESSNEASGLWRSASDTKGLFDPVMSFMGQKGGDASSSELPEKVISPQHPAAAERDNSSAEAPAMTLTDLIVDSSASEDKATDKKEEVDSQVPDGTADLHAGFHDDKDEYGLQAENASATGENVEDKDSECLLQHSKEANLKHDGESHLEESAATTNDTDTVEQLESAVIPVPDESPVNNEEQVNQEKEEADVKQFFEKSFPGYENAQDDNGKLGPEISIPNLTSSSHLDEQIPDGSSDDHVSNSLTTTKIPDVPSESLNNDTNSSVQSEIFDGETRHLESSSKDQLKNSGMHAADFLDPATKLDKMDKEMRMMEAALQGAARQAQAKADEISKLMNENEQLKSKIESLEKKSVEAEVDALREEYHQRVSSLERKVYALTRERDTLRREQNKRSDVAALLKEKDEIISQVMAEGENLSKKQAVQESTIRKLRAQIRELEEEKQLLNSKLQVEETKVESIKKDKATTEKLLQETIEKNQAELTAQKDFYTSALNAAKEAEALAETRVNNEAKVELESRLREAAEREAMLVQTLEELRQTLSRTERQAVFREDMLQRDIDDLQKRYQASELRYNELITQVPESTRPLLRQIEAMQEAATRKAEAWAGVEQSLNSRLEAAEAKAATSEEKERIMNDRLSQTLSRMTVLETQIACLRTEQTQLSRTLEKERQRASESRQEYLAALEEVATQEGRVKQLEDDLRELRAKHKQEMQEVLVHRELLEKELEREKAARLELERNSHHEASVDERLTANRNRPFAENGNLSMRKLSSAGSISSTEESFYLQASLDSTESVFSDRRTGEAVSPYFLKSMTPSAFEAALRQKDGELASYVSRLASLESIRDSLAEELVKMTAHCEKLRAEAALLPGIRAELEALRRRHSSALELMGERDEELEELRADIIDLKEMYREQIDLLVNTIQTMGPSAVAV